MRKLQTLSGPAGTPTFELTGTFITIGRARDNTIHLNHRSVSKHHAIIIIEDDVPQLFDLHSTNSTYVNHQKTATAPLKANDEIHMGEFVFRFETDAVAPPPPVKAPAPQPVQETIAPDVFKKLAVAGPRATTGSIKPQPAVAAAPPPSDRSFIRLPTSPPPAEKPGLVQKLLKRESGMVKPPPSSSGPLSPPPPPVAPPAPAPAAPPPEQILPKPAAEPAIEGEQLLKKPGAASGERLLIKPGGGTGGDRLLKKPGPAKPE